MLRGERRPQIAVVQLRKMNAWMLPKGKLADGEDMLAAARREVLEETGHRVSIHEYLGTLAYEAGGRPKVVQFWRMQTLGGPVGELMRDVRAVEWLPLDNAVARLSHAREQAFLAHVGPLALRAAERSLRRAALTERSSRKRVAERTRGVPTAEVVDIARWLPPIDHAAPAPVDIAPLDELVAPRPPLRMFERAQTRPVDAPLPDALTPPHDMTANGLFDDAAGGVLERTWDWIRHVAQAQRPRRD